MNNKSIYISTFYGSDNYGTNLQAIGLSRQLEKMGYNVYMLGSFRVIPFLIKHPILLYARLINKINAKKSKLFFCPYPYKINDKRGRRLKKFREDNYRVENIGAKEWDHIISSRAIFVSGADIIWNPALGYPAKFFLDCAYFAKLPRFSYGSSVGALNLPNKYKRAYKRYLGSMESVGVREQSVAEMLQPILNRKVIRVIDPSLLLKVEDWDEYAEKAKVSVSIENAGFILCYFVMNDQRYWDYVKKVKEATGKQIIVLPMHELDEKQPYDVILDGTPYEFLWLLKNADYICTDSFHACALSLIYNKDFYLLRRERKAEDAKYDDFLKRYQLEDRVVQNEKVFNILPETDYVKANRQLEADRTESMLFLKEALGKC